MPYYLETTDIETLQELLLKAQLEYVSLLNGSEDYLKKETCKVDIELLEKALIEKGAIWPERATIFQ